MAEEFGADWVVTSYLPKVNEVFNADK